MMYDVKVNNQKVFNSLPLILDWRVAGKYDKSPLSPTATKNIGSMMCVR